MWCLAVLGVLLRRRAGRSVASLALLAFSPFITLALLAYGQEGVLRVYLFSLPWTAALAALALAPFPSAGKLKAYSTAKPAQALATALWMPRNGSGDDTVVFDRRGAKGLWQATDLARAAAGTVTGAGQAGLGQASSSAAPAAQERPPAAPASGLSGSGDGDVTVSIDQEEAEAARQAAAAGQAGSGGGQAGASGVESTDDRPPAVQTAIPDRRSPLIRQRRQIMILLCLAAMVFIAAIIAAVVVGG
jgi:hypothetical protein